MSKKNYAPKKSKMQLRLEAAMKSKKPSYTAEDSTGDKVEAMLSQSGSSPKDSGLFPNIDKAMFNHSTSDKDNPYQTQFKAFSEGNSRGDVGRVGEASERLGEVVDSLSEKFSALTDTTSTMLDQFQKMTGTGTGQPQNGSSPLAQGAVTGAVAGSVVSAGKSSSNTNVEQPKNPSSGSIPLDLASQSIKDRFNDIQGARGGLAKEISDLEAEHKEAAEGNDPTGERRHEIQRELDQKKSNLRGMEIIDRGDKASQRLATERGITYDERARLTKEKDAGTEKSKEYGYDVREQHLAEKAKAEQERDRQGEIAKTSAKAKRDRELESFADKLGKATAVVSSFAAGIAAATVGAGAVAGKKSIAVRGSTGLSVEQQKQVSDAAIARNQSPEAYLGVVAQQTELADLESVASTGDWQSDSQMQRFLSMKKDYTILEQLTGIKVSGSGLRRTEQLDSALQKLQKDNPSKARELRREFGLEGLDRGGQSNSEKIVGALDKIGSEFVNVINSSVGIKTAVENADKTIAKVIEAVEKVDEHISPIAKYIAKTMGEDPNMPRQTDRGTAVEGTADDQTYQDEYTTGGAVLAGATAGAMVAGPVGAMVGAGLGYLFLAPAANSTRKDFLEHRANKAEDYIHENMSEQERMLRTSYENRKFRELADEYSVSDRMSKPPEFPKPAINYEKLAEAMRSKPIEVNVKGEITDPSGNNVNLEVSKPANPSKVG